MNCFITIKDKTGINDTFTFFHQRETCLNPDESSQKAGISLCFLQGGRQLQDRQWQHVRSDIIEKVSLLGAYVLHIVRIFLVSWSVFVKTLLLL